MCCCSLFYLKLLFFFSSRRRHTRCLSDWSSDVCSSDLHAPVGRRAISGACAALGTTIDTLRPAAEAGLVDLGSTTLRFRSALVQTAVLEDRKSVVRERV